MSQNSETKILFVIIFALIALIMINVEGFLKFLGIFIFSIEGFYILFWLSWNWDSAKKIFSKDFDPDKP